MVAKNKLSDYAEKNQKAYPIHNSIPNDFIKKLTNVLGAMAVRKVSTKSRGNEEPSQ